MDIEIESNAKEKEEKKEWNFGTIVVLVPRRLIARRRCRRCRPAVMCINVELNWKGGASSAFYLLTVVSHSTEALALVPTEQRTIL